MKRFNFANRLGIQAAVVFIIYVVLWEETSFDDEWLILCLAATVLQMVSGVISFFRGHTISKK